MFFFFFFHFWLLLGVAYACSFGFGRFRCFCVSCFCFLLFRFCFCLFLFVFVVLFDRFGCCYCFFCFCFVVCSCMFCLSVLECFCCCCCCCLLLCFWGLLLFCSLHLLERSSCCSCFVIIWFVLFVFVCVCVFFSAFVFVSVSYENNCLPCNSGVFAHSISVSHFNFWFLLFVFVLFAFCSKMFLCLCVSASSLALFWITLYDFSFALHLLSCCCFLLWYFVTFWCLLPSGLWKQWFFKTVFLHIRVCVWLTLNSLSLYPIFPPFPSLKLRQAFIRMPAWGFPRPKTTPPTPIPEVIPWLALFQLGGLLRSWRASPPKRGVFDEKNGEHQPNLVGANFYKVLGLGPPPTKMTKNDENGENTPAPGARSSSDPLSQMGSFRDRGLAEVRHKPWLSVPSKVPASRVWAWGGLLVWHWGESADQSPEKIWRDTSQ